ncbi:MAG: type IX secretion system membrane protein PorP/SprF [Saprospiraceae bacterium]|nr:type IX secretion system membrane protein PorP/SprF [Saprospiraceae bacterium]
MIRAKLLLSSALLLFSLTVMAQQPAQYSLYMFNQYNFNSAYAGLDESVSATGVFRRQWLGLPGSPSTQDFNVHLPLYLVKGAFGLGIENDALGAERNIKITAAYNYQQQIGDSWISAGIRGGILQKTLDGTVLIPRDQDQIDNYIPTGIATSMAPIVDAGVYFKNESLQIGLSANNLLENSVDFALNEPTNIKFLRNYFFIFAYNLDIGSKINVSPSILVKSDIQEIQTDFSAIVKYNDNIMVGASFRGYNSNTIDAVVMMAGMKVTSNITIAYAYDLPLSGLSATNTGSHEIMLNYNLNKVFGAGVPPKIIYNPRFL